MLMVINPCKQSSIWFDASSVSGTDVDVDVDVVVVAVCALAVSTPIGAMSPTASVTLSMRA